MPTGWVRIFRLRQRERAAGRGARGVQNSRFKVTPAERDGQTGDHQQTGTSSGGGVSQVHENLRERSAVGTLCIRWIPHNFTEAQELRRVNWCREMMQTFAGGDSNAVYNMATVFDEMAIRKQRLFHNQQKLGAINFGAGPQEGDADDNVASQALVFMLVSMTEHWKIPVGYFLIAGATADTKANLITTCLQKCHDAGVSVVSVTFDGCSANLAAAEILGCKLTDPNNLVTHFPYPCTEEKRLRAQAQSAGEHVKELTLCSPGGAERRKLPLMWHFLRACFECIHAAWSCAPRRFGVEGIQKRDLIVYLRLTVACYA
ncbi:DNA transposase THAP9 [Eumeta japonica]|uniref:DNA transposase THAP9 n=1 Tax=Eumeta variegata TaxID=151549 RepID=A0A4C1TB16_EUMVA|nr:DNA transposase THAP9 [Eumeta japonica]